MPRMATLEGKLIVTFRKRRWVPDDYNASIHQLLEVDEVMDGLDSDDLDIKNIELEESEVLDG